MGGIKFIISTKNININNDYINAFINISSRGPDNTNYIRISTPDLNQLHSNHSQLTQIHYQLSKNQIKNYIQYNFVLGYHRLIINDLSDDAMQPFEDPILHMTNTYPQLKNRPQRQLLCNGEIYNYKFLKNSNNFSSCDLQSSCDVEIIMPLYIKYLTENENNTINALLSTINDLNGDFAFILSENLNSYILNSINIFAVRDHFGIKPLYYIKDNYSDFYIFVSEIKGIPSFIINNSNYSIIQVPPGSYWSFQNKIQNKIQKSDFTTYYSLSKFENIDNCIIDFKPSILTTIQHLITKSTIDKYILSNKPIGILLSGGFNSSIITSLILDYLTNQKEPFEFNIFTIGDELNSKEDNNSIQLTKKLISFLENKYNIIIHFHIIYINEIEILVQDIEQIIYILETYDSYTIQQGIIYYYLFKYINEHTNIKVLLTGDGLEELCGYNNTNDQAFQTKSIKLLSNLFTYNLQIGDRMCNNFSLELRYPFLDKDFVEYILTLHPKLKQPQNVSKYIIRKSFEGLNLLPDNILWCCHKNINNSLTNFELRLNNYINNQISDNTFNTIISSLLNNPLTNNSNILPQNKIDAYFRSLFEKFYPGRSYLIPVFWNNLNL